MKKGGKKWRKLQQEKAESQAIEKVEEPSSKKRNNIHICEHYEWNYGFISHNWSELMAVSLLEPIGEKECQCTRCGKVFPIEKYRNMKAQVSHNYTELTEGFDPGYYKRKCNTTIVMLDTAEDAQTHGYYSQESIHLCKHYVKRHLNEDENDCRSLLDPINETECRCKQCGKVFSLDKHQQMETLTARLSHEKKYIFDPNPSINIFKLFEYRWVCTDSWNDEVAKVVEPVRYKKFGRNIEIID